MYVNAATSLKKSGFLQEVVVEYSHATSFTRQAVLGLGKGADEIKK